MAFCLGAAFDFYSGHVRRAPLWMQKLGMEWLWRLFSNPRRFAKRYLVDDFFPFLAMTFAEAWRSRLSRKKA
jgi:N-acetylglucosaminyldiphosphoundecaprenol N-acetyl-beta-D-mannosaminyltransferase